MQPTNNLCLIRFGVFEVNVKTGELRKQGARIKLQEQPFQVLAMLLEKPGEIVTREEMQQKLWPKDTFVDFDHSLNKAINKIRDALCDSADNPRFIETLARRGYRFIAPVQWNDAKIAAPTGVMPAAGVKSLEAPSNQETFSRRKVPGNKMTLVLAAIVLVLLVSYLFRPALAPPRLSQGISITSDGVFGKGVIVCDGSSLFFNETGKIAQVSVSGGQTVAIPLALSNTKVQPFLFDFSPSRHELLLQLIPPEEFNDGKVGELWSLQIPVMSLRRIGDLSINAAMWAPDGQKVLYTISDNVFLAQADGSASRQLATFRSTIGVPSWSPDGKLVRFTLPSSKAGFRKILDMKPDPSRFNGVLQMKSDGSNILQLFSNWVNEWGIWHGCWSPDGKYYLFVARQNNPTFDIWAFQEKKGFLKRAIPEPIQLTSGPMDYSWPAFSPDGRRLFAVGTLRYGELVHLDPQTGHFLPLLNGISAYCVDYTKDGEWVTYVTYPQGDLWRSKVDGSQKLQLTFPPMQAYQPRWSPNGKQIVFQGLKSGSLYEILLISAEGGSPKPLLPAGSNGDAPNWSPDGQKIVYGDFPFPWEGSSAKTSIKILDLKTGQIIMIGGSEGLISPQWSPDGNHIVAVTLGDTKFHLFSWETQKWEPVSQVQGNWPKWSRDGKAIYFDDFGINRLRISDFHLEKMTDLKGIRRVANNLSWMGLTPDDRPMIMKDIGTQEIYAFDWIAP